MFYYEYSYDEPRDAYPFAHWNSRLTKADCSITAPDFRGEGHPLEYRIILNLTNGPVTASDGYVYLALDDEEIVAVKKILQGENGELVVTMDMINEYLKALVEKANELAKTHSMLRLRTPLFLARVSRKSPDREPDGKYERLVIVMPRQPGVVYQVVK